MQSPTTKTQALLALARNGPVRARDLDRAGIPRTYLRRLCERGLLEQVDRGLYRLADATATELNTLAEVSKRVPHGVISLLSALQLYGLTTETPHAVWLLIERHARAPKLRYPQVEIVRASGAARDHGVTELTIDGVAARVTTPAKTVADCFRYRRHVGLDVALSALRDYLARSRGRARESDHHGSGPRRQPGEDFSIDALVAAARADRVFTLMRPYIEALT